MSRKKREREKTLPAGLGVRVCSVLAASQSLRLCVSAWSWSLGERESACRCLARYFLAIILYSLIDHDDVNDHEKNDTEVLVTQ